MAELAKIVALIQGKTGNVTDGYRNVIETTIESAWAEISMRHEWWFLRHSSPEKVSVTANNAIYALNRSDIGRMLYMSKTETGKAAVFYKDRREFDSYQPDPYSDNANAGTPLIFTDFGIGNDGKQRIVLYPSPETAGDYYLHYCRRGDISNLSLMPNEFINCLQHAVMAVLAPPEERRDWQGRLWWKAMTKDEFAMYEESLKRLIVSAPRVAPGIPDHHIDPYIQSRLEDVGP